MSKVDVKNDLQEKLENFERQHEKLIELVNMSIKVVERSSPDQIYDILAVMTNDFTNQFSIEEKLLRQYKYPEYTIHRQSHRTFIKRILFYRRGSEENHERIVEEVSKFLKNWLANHVLELDREYFSFIRVQLFLDAHHK